jgi:hypothetical protein
MMASRFGGIPVEEEKRSRFGGIPVVAEEVIVEEPEPERYLYNENGTVSGINPEAAPTRQESSDYVRGLGQKLLSGQGAGFGDELVGGVRALTDNSEYDFGENMAENTRDLGEDYTMYRDDARAAEEQFAEQNPNTALAAELAGAIASPLNKVAPGFGAGAKNSNLGSRLYQSVARGTAEGGLYGLGQAEGTMDEQLQQAVEGAKFGGGVSAALTGGGGALGRTMSKLRVKDRLVDAAGNFKPIHLADAEGTAGKLYRNIVGGAFGGRGELGRQESRYLNSSPRLARFAKEGKDLVEENVGTKIELNRVGDEIVDTNRIAKDTSERAVKRLNQASAKAKGQITEDVAANAAKSAGRVKMAANAVDEQIPVINERVAREAVDASIPTTIPAERAAEIRQMSPIDAEKAISDFFSSDGFRAVKDRDFRWEPKLLSRIKTMLDDNPELKTQVGGAVGGIKRLDDYLNPGRGLSGKVGSGNIDEALKAGGVPGDVLMEIRNTFARKANSPMPSLAGKGNRTIAKEFDAMIENRLGTDSKEWASYADEISAWGPKQALSKAARQARKGGVDIDAKNIGSKAPDRGPLQQSARVAREEVVGLKQAARRAKAAAAENKTRVGAQATKQKQQLTDATNKQVSREGQRAKRAGQVARASKNRLDRASEGTLPENSTAWSQAAATALLGGMLGGPLGAGGALLSGASIARGLASPRAQKFAAGQLGWQEAMAKALQEGDTAKYQQILARISAQQGTN